jgi:hypothetical protein
MRYGVVWIDLGTQQSISDASCCHSSRLQTPPSALQTLYALNVLKSGFYFYG